MRLQSSGGGWSGEIGSAPKPDSLSTGFTVTGSPPASIATSYIGTIKYKGFFEDKKLEPLN